MIELKYYTVIQNYFLGQRKHELKGEMIPIHLDSPHLPLLSNKHSFFCIVLDHSDDIKTKLYTLDENL